MHEGHTHPAEAAATGASAVARAFATAIDPICGMKVDIEKAAAAGLTVKYQGKNYYFCTDDCKETFGKDPKRYAAAAKTSGRTP